MKNPVSFVVSFMPQQVFDPRLSTMVSGGLETIGSLRVKCGSLFVEEEASTQIHPDDVLKFSTFLNRDPHPNVFIDRRSELETYQRIIRLIGAELTFGLALQNILSFRAGKDADARPFKAAYHQFTSLVQQNNFILTTSTQLSEMVMKQVGTFRNAVFNDTVDSFKAFIDARKEPVIFENKTSGDYANVTSPFIPPF